MILISDDYLHHELIMTVVELGPLKCWKQLNGGTVPLGQCDNLIGYGPVTCMVTINPQENRRGLAEHNIMPFTAGTARCNSGKQQKKHMFCFSLCVFVENT